jgi:hypothetical protein
MTKPLALARASALVVALASLTRLATAADPATPQAAAPAAIRIALTGDSTVTD